MIKVSDYIVKFLEEQGVDHMFMLPGPTAMHINDSVGYAEHLFPVWMLHEQAATFAAESYARVTNRLGVVCTTSGPSATSTLTGIAGSWIESTPLLVITGQVRRQDIAMNPDLRQLGVQEIHIVDMAKPVTKYAKQVLDPESIRYHLEKAVYLAREGRPGPVLLDIPVDVQGCMVDESHLRRFTPYEVTSAMAFAQIDEVIAQLRKAKRPVIYAGAGVDVAGARDELRQLVERLNIPLLVHWNAIDLIESDHPLYIGRPGARGQRAANFVLQNADLLLTVGTRLDLQQTGLNFSSFARNARHIMVDIDPAELSKPTLHPFMKIQTDARLFLRSLVGRPDVGRLKCEEWVEQCRRWNEKYTSLNPQWLDDKSHINSYYLVDCISRCMDADTIYVSGRAGTCVDATIQALRVKKGQRAYLTTGLSPMGNGVPAAIGAAYASGKKIVCVTGDGSFVMNIQEMEVIRRDSLPIKVFILDNKSNATVRNNQAHVFNRHFVGCDTDSGLTVGNIRAIVEAYGIRTFALDSYADMERTVGEVLAVDGPAVCVVSVDPDQPIVPCEATYKTAEGQLAARPLEDMQPLLPKEELDEIMAVSATAYPPHFAGVND